MKWSFGVEKTNEMGKYWNELKEQGWDNRLFGLLKFRVANVIPAMIKESGKEGWLVECESNLLEYLKWIFDLKREGKEKMILKGWLSEKGQLRR